MLDKFNYYDAIAHVIPGAVICLFFLYIVDILGLSFPKVSQGSLTEVGIGIVVSYVAGHLLQALASTAEPIYYACWGGKPSAKLLAAQSKTFTDVQREKLVGNLASHFEISEHLPRDNKGKMHFYQRLFERCMAVCNKEKLGRVELFEVSYSFHRALLTTFLLIFLLSGTVEELVRHNWLAIEPNKSAVLSFLLYVTRLGAVIEFFRARKRAYYYAKEVLLMTADHIRSTGPNLS